ncbi:MULTISPECIES: hypothetical protein [unclassified Cupriavidus]|uniref:hypothetical protein n=1 Tax=unclassified Cupriavidus TaxID=2640874 RepID=UPI000E8BE4F0|nr:MULTISPECIES: hypothetical protein [unclassified Cupriavidus]HBD40054.1 hypothetical protein [Cupriavidus sp.]
MKTIDTILVLAFVLAAFGAGVQYDSHRIQATCESDEALTIINGTEYVCLSPRHMQMLRRQQQSWRGA